MDSQAEAAVRQALALHRGEPGALLPVLHDVQDRLGHVPSEALPLLGKSLNLSRAEVHGVVTFYPHFRTRSAGRHILRICRAEACQAMGADALAAHAQAALSIDMHATTDDGLFTLEPVFCLGNCACSPAVMIDDDLYGRVDASRFDALVAGLSDRS